MLEEGPSSRQVDMEELKKRETAALNRITEIFNRFIASAGKLGGSDAWTLLEEDARNLHQEIMEVKAVVSPWNPQDQMEQAGDVLVSLLGYMDLIRLKVRKPEEAAKEMQSIFQNYQGRFVKI